MNNTKDEITARRAQVQEIVDTVFDVACHQLPECAERWRKVQAGLKQLLQETNQWKDTRGFKTEI